jgi:hypothetical protein
MSSSKNTKGNGMTEKIKDQGTIKQQPRKEEDIEYAEAQDARQEEHKCMDNEICHSISETCNNKLRMETKVTYPSGA